MRSKFFCCLTFAFSMAAAYAVDYEIVINDYDFDAGTQGGANYYIKTQLNQTVNIWRPGDKAILIQNGVKYTYIYNANGNFAFEKSESVHGGGGGGGEGSGGGSDGGTGAIGGAGFVGGNTCYINCGGSGYIKITDLDNDNP